MKGSAQFGAAWCCICTACRNVAQLYNVHCNMHTNAMVQVAQAHTGGLSLELFHAQALADWECMVASAVWATAAEARGRLELLLQTGSILPQPQPLTSPVGLLPPPLGEVATGAAAIAPACPCSGQQPPQQGTAPLSTLLPPPMPASEQPVSLLGTPVLPAVPLGAVGGSGGQHTQTAGVPLSSVSLLQHAAALVHELQAHMQVGGAKRSNALH